ncbi:MAG: c-type cytochrome [Bryobacteraceae bacterium]
MISAEWFCTVTLLLAAVGAPVNAQNNPPSPAPRPGAPRDLPDGPGKETVQKVCGTCHTASMVLGRNSSREEWSEVIANMVAKGAKGTSADFAQVLDYLTTNMGPKAPAPGTAPPRRTGGLTQGPNDKHVVDAQSAERGKSIYIAECITCHGPRARGQGNGTDLVRSVTVLHDRYGSTIGPFLRKGHRTQSGAGTTAFTAAQISDLANFLHQQVNDTLKSGPFNKVLNVLTGDRKAGEAYFNGKGKCSTCHSPSGDLAGIASKYDPPTLQQRFLFPRTTGFNRGQLSTAKPVSVTVTDANGSVSGTLEKMDDFDVSLRDGSGEYHSFKRTPSLKIEKHDPYAAHIELLDVYTDKDIHDIVAYLETLK